MDKDQQFLDYIRMLIGYDNPVLKELDDAAAQRDDIQPFVEKEAARMLGLLVRLMKAQSVLELGMGVAYSTIWLASAVKETGGKLVSIDNHPRTVVEAREHLEHAGVADVVEILFGDAQAMTDQLLNEHRVFDVIFQDCGKSVYNVVYEDLYHLLRPGGLLVTDDTLMHFDPKVRKGLGAYTSEYNNRLFEDERYYSVLLPVGQGITLSLKR